MSVDFYACRVMKWTPHDSTTAESQLSGRPGEAPAYAGTDFIIARDGRIAALYLFFDKLPRAGLC